MSAPVPSGRADATTRQGSRRGSSGRVVALGLAAVVTWVLLRTGPGLVPGVDSHEEVARAWPHSDVTPRTAYVLRAPLGQLVYRALPEQGLDVFVALHVVALLTSAGLLLAWLLRRHGRQAGAVAATVLLLAPLTAVLLEWVGVYDAFSLLAWVLVVMSLPGPRAAQVLAAALAGLQNLEQVLVGLVVLALLPELSRRAAWRPWLPGLLGGAVAGRVGLEAYLASVEAPSGSRLTFLLHDQALLVEVLHSSLVSAPLLVMSVLGGLWVLAVPVVLRDWPRWSPGLRARLVLTLLLLLAVGTVTADHTRVMALSSVPAVVAGAVAVGTSLPTYGAFWRRPDPWLMLLFPPVVAFGDAVLPLGLLAGTT